MKNLFGFILLFTLTFGLTACSSDDDGPIEPEFSIVGNWKVSAKMINNVQQDITDECAFKGNVKFVNGGIFVEDVWMETDETPCHLEGTLGGNWEKAGNSYQISISTEGMESILPLVFTPEVTDGNFNQFSISATSLGTTTTLVFSRII